MKNVPFTISFVTRFEDVSEVANVPDEVLSEVCRQGLVELFEDKYLPELNKGASRIFLELVK